MFPIHFHQVLLAFIGLIAGLLQCEASAFLGPVKTSLQDAEASLLQSLAGGASQGRLLQLKKSMESTFNALPKGAHGYLEHNGMTYLLQRLFIDKHGWYIRGLEPNSSGLTRGSSNNSTWVPAHLQDLLEKRIGERGIGLQELAALAATYEDLIAQESLNRYETIEKLFDLPKEMGPDQFKGVLKAYTVTFLKNGRVPSEAHDFQRYVNRFASLSRVWNETVEFLEDTYDVDAKLTKEGLIDVASSTAIFSDIGLNFHTMNDRQCHGLKITMLALEDRVPGRVRLTEFYNKSFYSAWNLNERPEYLRTLGALDETEPDVPRVIIPNYMQSMPNCVKPSDLYSICCRNECEGLMAYLEKHVAAPEGDTRKILRLVSALPSDTVVAPRKVPESLSRRLFDIAASHGGKVPLHGRLFAQWMHHAYPRECPYPHLSGATSRQSPDEWKNLNGIPSSWETSERMQEFISNSTCPSTASCPSTADEITWHSEEELPLVVRMADVLKTGTQTAMRHAVGK